MIDKFGRNINYLRISLTDKCNLGSIYSMSENIKVYREFDNDILNFDDYKFLIKSMADLGISKVRFTGGEPLLYPKLIEIIRFAKEECNIEDIAITTNGSKLHEVAHLLKESGLSKVNISIDSLKEYKYKAVTQGGALKDVLKSINACLKLGVEVKINCVVVDGFNDDEIYDFILMTNYYPIDIRFIEFIHRKKDKTMYKMGYFDIKKIIDDIEEIYPINYTENSTAQYYKFKGSKGNIGVIAPISCSFCSNCNKILITSDGNIKLCLHCEEEIDIKDYLHKPLIFREMMKDIILNKPKEHNLI